MRVKFHASRLPPLCCAALGVLLTLLLVGGFAWQQTVQGNRVWAQMYGESLASMTAKSAIDSTLNHDLVSLQVVLQDVVLSPRVVFATIHDVENNLLVQAGTVPSAHQMNTVDSYSAAIGFQQSVAGYVSVHIDKPRAPETLWWAYWGSISLALCVASLALVDANARVFEWQDKPVQTEESGERSPGLTSVKTVSQITPAPELVSQQANPVSLAAVNDPENRANAQAFVVKATAQIVLQIVDFTKLQKTLSADRVGELKTQWLDVAQMALNLYGGQWASAPTTSLTDGALIALFPSAQSKEEAIKTAAFFGAVVKAAFKPPQLRVNVDAIVGLQDEFMHLSSRPASSFAVYFSSDRQRQALATRIHFAALDGCWWQLDAFNASYQALLDKQATQLSQGAVLV
ncbi:hypothetical protein [Marinagarivorans algicola]|uniref:hypothetical protein n=1 Tax=Marinagarivorans algicola TaxID=1513270 RepID=UPI0006B91FA7|nr:hypothetical protein [Marinagarivorans algicola]